MKAAVYVGTRNVYGDIIPSLKSLLINSDVDKVYLLIEDDEFPYELPDCVETINVSGQPYFRHDGPNYSTIPWTWMTMMRAALWDLFPDLDVILSLDNDTIIDKDISELWDLPIADYYFSAARAPAPSPGGPRRLRSPSGAAAPAASPGTSSSTRRGCSPFPTRRRTRSSCTATRAPAST